ncbi:MAG: potassium channel family protein [Anaerolineae bacterium]
MSSVSVRRLRFALLIIFGLIVAGTAGYHLLEGMSFVDGLYMTIITLTTVGFGEVEPLSHTGRLFTIGLILSGVVAGAWAVQNAVEVLLSEQLWRTVGRRRVARAIEKLDGHYIVCGYGRMGRETALELRRRGVPFVVIESQPDIVQALLDEDVPVIEGDATYDETLQAASIERARGLVAAVNTDADNVLIVLTAKEINPQLTIVARAAVAESERKLYRAGADRVVTPYTIGGRRIALALLRPTISEFLSTVVYTEELDTEMGELHVHVGSPFANKTVRETELRSQWGATVIGIKTQAGRLIISPSPEHRLQEGDVLLVIAETSKLRELEKL